MSNDAIAAALDAAVRKRCSTATGRTVKMLAAGIGASPDAVQQWMSGRAKVPAWAIAAMARWFGDGQFLGDVFGSGASTTPTPVAPAGGDLCLWIDADGAVLAAPHGHEAAARSALAVGDPGDVQWAAYAVRAAGWIAITLQADQRLVLRLSEARATTAAVARACAWMPGPAGVLSGLTLRVLSTSREWTATDFDTLPAARRALESIVGIGGPSVTGMRIAVERRGLAAQADPVMTAALRHWDGSLSGARQMGAAIAAAGGSARAGLFRCGVDGFDCADLGQGLPISPAIKGRSIAALGEPDYVAMVGEHFRTTLAEGRPTLHRIDIQAHGDRGLYDRFAAPVDDDGVPSILVVSQVIDPPRRVVLGQHGGRA